MAPHADELFTVLLNVLSDDSDEVVLQGLVVLAEIVSSTQAKGKSSLNVFNHVFLHCILHRR